MKRSLFAAVFILAMLLAAPPAAQAVPFTGTVDYVGVHTVDGTDFSDSTLVNIVLAFVLEASGDFLLMIGDSLSHATPIIYNPETYPIDPLWTHASGIFFGLTSFSSTVTEGGLILTLTGSGYFGCNLPCTGFENTPGNWLMTLNLADGRVIGKYSANSEVRDVPEPGSLILFGMGLLAAARTYRRRLA